MKLYRFWNTVAALCLLIGCHSTKVEESPNAEVPLLDGETAPGTTPFPGFPPIRLRQQLLEPDFLPQSLPSTDSNKKQNPKRYTITVQNNTSLREILRPILKDLELSLIIDADVNGRTPAIELRQVSLEQLLYAMLHPVNADYRKSGNFLHIFRRKSITKIFKINYLASVRSTEGTIVNSSTSGGEGRISSQVSTNFWKDVENGLNLLIPSSLGFNQPPIAVPRSSSRSTENNATLVSEPIRFVNRFVINRKSGVILVTASPKLLEEVSTYLHWVTESTLRQVQIRVQIAEVKLNSQNKFGIDWERISDQIASADVTLNQTSAGSLGTVVQDANVFTANFSSPKTNIILQALQTSGEVKILSSPILTTLNNEPAMFKSAQDRSFFSVTRTQNLQGDQIVENFNADVKVVTLGLSLRITPQIGDSGDVLIDVHPTITELARVAQAVDRDGNFLASSPDTDVRELNTVVRVAHGETAVIGGLIRDQASEREVGVPFLKDIPGLGTLFKSREDTIEKTELVLFMTPQVVSGNLVEEIDFGPNDLLQEKFPDLFGGSP